MRRIPLASSTTTTTATTTSHPDGDATLDNGPDPDRRPRDEGVSLVEITISIVLLGSIIAATLTALTTTITASALDRDHANAHAWLQTASDMLYAREVRQCDESKPAAEEIAATIDDYQDTVSATENPEDWESHLITVTGVQWWSIDKDANGVGVESWGTVCDSIDTNLQRVSLRVRAPDGKIVEEVEVIIGG
jgi:type II secretory pathway pseudopilin PulG